MRTWSKAAGLVGALALLVAAGSAARGADGPDAAKSEGSLTLRNLHPSREATLARGERIWVDVDYASDAPVRISASGFVAGRGVGGYDVPAMHAAGRGAAVMSFWGEGSVDEIRVEARRASDGAVVAHLSVPVSMWWSESKHERAPVPDWLAARRAESDRSVLAESPPASGSDGGSAPRWTTLLIRLAAPALLLGLVLGPLLGVVLALVRWRGGWRWAAGAPLLAYGAWALRLARDLRRDPTSHDLFPFELAFLGAGTLVYLLVAAALHRAAVRTAAADGTGPAGPAGPAPRVPQPAPDDDASDPGPGSA